MPPSISDSLSSSDAIVREGANVSLTCHVDGYPKPEIKWKRDDGLQININKTLTGTQNIEYYYIIHRMKLNIDIELKITDVKTDYSTKI